MDVICELYPVEMTAIFASKRIFAAAATGGARTAELPSKGGPIAYWPLGRRTVRGSLCLGHSIWKAEPIPLLIALE